MAEQVSINMFDGTSDDPRAQWAGRLTGPAPSRDAMVASAFMYLLAPSGQAVENAAQAEIEAAASDVIEGVVIEGD